MRKTGWAVFARWLNRKSLRRDLGGGRGGRGAELIEEGDDDRRKRGFKKGRGNSFSYSLHSLRDDQEMVICIGPGVEKVPPPPTKL